jgi:phthiocerol/phenolphthiocerol synthesis type-I polyketide synthase E
MIPNKHTGLEIAIIGISCRLPGAANWRQYWDNLINGVESVQYFSKEELLKSGCSQELVDDPNFVPATACLKGKDCFDASIFGYTPDEARLMNPVHRVFHECAWEAMEDAGYNPAQANGNIGVYAGAGGDLNWKVYSLLNNQDNAVADFSLEQISNKDHLATLLSYKLDMRGPAVAVDTACSTSLVAVHLACRALLLGESKMALAGGVSIGTETQKGYYYKEEAISSKDGHCRAFDMHADGTIGGEGAGVIVLKKLKDAVSDGDHIYAVIKGSAVNNDGKRKVGYTAPSVEGQAECIRMAHLFAKIDPASIAYVEAHGTGTKLGDPIEIEALNLAFSSNLKSTCPIGSVKTNIGHVDAAAGIAGLIKTALSLQYRELPPSLHYSSPNPMINFEGGPFYVNSQRTPWKTSSHHTPLRAGVSAFGIGGTNAHVVLEEHPEVEISGRVRSHQVLSISGNTAKALQRNLDNLSKFLAQEQEANLANIAYTLHTGRKAFPYRISIPFKDREELVGLLQSIKYRDELASYTDRNPSIVFLFPGIGSQYPNMGRGLYEEEPFFKEEMDKGFAILKEITGEDYHSILFTDSKEDIRIHETIHAQPAIFLFEYALARLLMSNGIEPDYMVGHSLGEYTAACIAGVFSFKEALKIVVKRGILMQGLGRGAMISVAMNAAEAASYVNGKVAVAAVNSPGQVVLSGDKASIDSLEAEFVAKEIGFTRLHASVAAHSPHTDAISGAFLAELQTLVLNAPEKIFLSNLSGKFIKEDEATSVEYWVRHLRETVQFSASMQTLLEKDEKNIFIEIGGGHSLTSLLKQHGSKAIKSKTLNLIRHPKEVKSDARHFAEGIGKLWDWGASLNMKTYYAGFAVKRASLPTYSFEPTIYPTEVNPLEQSKLEGKEFSEQLRIQSLPDWVYYPGWKRAYFDMNQSQSKNILFFSCGDQLSKALLDELLKIGNRVVEILTGKEYLQLSEDKFIMAPEEVAQFRRLKQDLEEKHMEFSDILYSWNLGMNPGHSLITEQNSELELGYFGLVNIIPLIARPSQTRVKKITILTKSLYKVTGAETINAPQALVVGLANVMAQEHQIQTVNIDFCLDRENEQLAKDLTLEFCQDRNPQDRIVALRYGQTWVREYQKAVFKTSGMEVPIRQGGVYLITGGLGNLGFVLARHLISKYKAKLVLVGRETLDEMKPGGKKRKHLRSLQALSEQVIYCPADVADYTDLERVISDTEKQWGQIHGIIHAAGLVDNKYFELTEETTRNKTLSMFSAKITGVHHIVRLAKDKPLDFIWVASSLASILGGLSHAAYSSANLYIDQYITGLPESSTILKAIGLSEIFFNENEIQAEQLWNRKGLKPAEIVQLFEWSLSDINSRVTLETTTDLQRRLRFAYTPLRTKVEEDDDRVLAITEKKLVSSPYQEACSDLEKQLQQIFEEFFGTSGIGIDDNFFELGGDSLKGMVLLRKIGKQFDVDIPLKEIFTATTIREMARNLEVKILANSENNKKFSTII